MMGLTTVNQDLPEREQTEWVYISPVDEYGREIVRPTRVRRTSHGKRAQRRLSKPWAHRR